MTGTQLTEIAKLPLSAAHCTDGPRVESRRTRTTIDYDAEGEDGGAIWTRLYFDGVIASKFTPETGTTEYMADAYDCICEMKGSTWLEDLRNLAASRHQSLHDDLKHFVVFFDHWGCYEFIGKEAGIEK